jgi:hypothetical protein
MISVFVQGGCRRQRLECHGPASVRIPGFEHGPRRTGTKFVDDLEGAQPCANLNGLIRHGMTPLQ